MTEATKLCLIGGQKWSQTSISASWRRTKSFAWKIDFLVHKTTFPWIHVLYAISSSLDSFATCSITRIFLSSGQSWCFTFSNLIVLIMVLNYFYDDFYRSFWSVCHKFEDHLVWQPFSLLNPAFHFIMRTWSHHRTSSWQQKRNYLINDLPVYPQLFMLFTSAATSATAQPWRSSSQ